MSFDAAAFQQFEHEGWNKKAAGYHDVYEPIVAKAVEAALDRVEAGPGRRLLDVGSGPGYVAAAAASRGSEVVGVDLAESMVALARELHPDLEFEVADAQDLPFPEGSFETAVASFALFHMPRPDFALAELARVLRPGGRLAMTTGTRPTATASSASSWMRSSRRARRYRQTCRPGRPCIQSRMATVAS